MLPLLLFSRNILNVNNVERCHVLLIITLGVIKIYKSPKDGKAHYKAQLNGKNEERKDIRVVITLPPYLSDDLSSEQTNLLLCKHMVKDKVIIVNLHKDLHKGPVQETLDIDPDGVLGF